MIASSSSTDVAPSYVSSSTTFFWLSICVLDCSLKHSRVGAGLFQQRPVDCIVLYSIDGEDVCHDCGLNGSDVLISSFLTAARAVFGIVAPSCYVCIDGMNGGLKGHQVRYRLLLLLPIEHRSSRNIIVRGIVIAVCSCPRQPVCLHSQLALNSAVSHHCCSCGKRQVEYAIGAIGYNYS